MPAIAPTPRVALAALLVAAAAVLPPRPLSAQESELATVDLVVTDSATHAPVVGARVASSGLRYTAVSDATGRVRLRDLSAGRHRVAITHPQYAARERTVEVQAGQTVRLAVALPATAVALDPLVAEGRSARLQEFYDRVDRGTGHSVTREEIERRRPRRFTDIFRGIPNLMVASNRGRAHIRLGRSSVGRECPPTYYLDGTRFHPGNLDVELRPELIEGVEVYPGNQVPPRFRASDAACGVILIWTRDRS